MRLNSYRTCSIGCVRYETELLPDVFDWIRDVRYDTALIPDIFNRMRPIWDWAHTGRLQLNTPDVRLNSSIHTARFSLPWPKRWITWWISQQLAMWAESRVILCPYERQMSMIISVHMCRVTCITLRVWGRLSMTISVHMGRVTCIISAPSGQMNIVFWTHYCDAKVLAT